MQWILNIDDLGHCKKVACTCTNHSISVDGKPLFKHAVESVSGITLWSTTPRGVEFTECFVFQFPPPLNQRVLPAPIYVARGFSAEATLEPSDLKNIVASMKKLCVARSYDAVYDVPSVCPDESDSEDQESALSDVYDSADQEECCEDEEWDSGSDFVSP